MSKGESLFEDASLEGSDEGMIDISQLSGENEADAAGEEESSEDDGPVIETPEADVEIKEEDDDGLIDTDSFLVEKEIETPKGGEDNNSVDGTPSSDNSSSQLQIIKTSLLDEGTISLEEDEEIESIEQLTEAIARQVELASIESLRLNGKQKIYLEGLEAGIPEDDIKQNLSNIETLNGITPEAIEGNENLRRSLITEGLISDGLTRAKAEKSAQRIIEAGDDLDEARDAYNSLKTTEEERMVNEIARLKKEASDKRIADIAKDKEIKADVLATREFIPGIKANSSTSQKVYNSMTKIVGHDAQGNPLNAMSKARLDDPEKMEKIEHYLFEITKGYTDIKVLEGKVNTKNVKALGKKLKTGQTSAGTSKSVSQTAGGGLSAALDFALKRS